MFVSESFITIPVNLQFFPSRLIHHMENLQHAHFLFVQKCALQNKLFKVLGDLLHNEGHCKKYPWFLVGSEVSESFITIPVNLQSSPSRLIHHMENLQHAHFLFVQKCALQNKLFKVLGDLLHNEGHCKKYPWFLVGSEVDPQSRSFCVFLKAFAPFVREHSFLSTVRKTADLLIFPFFFSSERGQNLPSL